MAVEFHGEPVDIDDPFIRKRVSDDLGLPPLGGTNG
jgi:hypothetical protein